VVDSVLERLVEEPDGSLVAHVRPKRRYRQQCGICAKRSPLYDQGEGRHRWRGLDVGFTRFFVEAAAPRVSCPEHGPNATICLDPFHVVHWATTALDKVRKAIWNEACRSGQQLATREIKGSRWALLRNPERLTADQATTLAMIAKLNAPLYRAYLLKEQLRMVFHVGYHKAVDLLERWNWVPLRPGADRHVRTHPWRSLPITTRPTILVTGPTAMPVDPFNDSYNMITFRNACPCSIASIAALISSRR
jgi:transposase